ncbi:MAG: zf-HC2 domain-containing protein [Armatimonadetes bacterium]|nr:zf-HC2 domain-containing protein [Armatimonadota bacterium]
MDMEGFSYQEAAEILAMPMGTLMSRLHRARHRLQKELWEYCVRVGICRAVKPPPPIKPECAVACRYLYDFIEGALDEQTAAQVQSHLDTCLMCCDRLEFQRRLRQVIRERHKGKLPKPVRRRLSNVMAFLV